MKSLLKKIIPEKFLLLYHYLKSFVATQIFGNPSKDLLVIGITGTKGKSTTANFIWSALQAGGIQTGLIGTANIKIGEIEMMNKWHMTMPSPFILQKLLKKMKNLGCKVVVLEVTSEGIKQYRQKNIDFDIGVFTNLSPEHLSSHNNSFEEYKNKKKKFFLGLSKKLNAKIFVNGDSKYSDFFLDSNISKKILVSLKNNSQVDKKYKKIDFKGEIIKISEKKTTFLVEEKNQKFKYEIYIGGTKNVENALLAIALARNLKIHPKIIQKGFNLLKTIPGRMEKIEILSPFGKYKKFPRNFSVFVDYAHEKLSMNFLMETGQLMIKKMRISQNISQKKPRIIVLLGAEGGGRDTTKRGIMGEIVAKKADIVIISNVDPYNDNPMQIIEDIAQAVEKNSNKKRGKDLFLIEDRRKGIAKCLELAKYGNNDIVFITGKGSEQSIVINGVSTPWDDRKVVKEELMKVSKQLFD